MTLQHLLLGPSRGSAAELQRDGNFNAAAFPRFPLHL